MEAFRRVFQAAAKTIMMTLKLGGYVSVPGMGTQTISGPEKGPLAVKKLIGTAESPVWNLSSMIKIFPVGAPNPLQVDKSQIRVPKNQGISAEHTNTEGEQQSLF
jgi:hypothetical protein